MHQSEFELLLIPTIFSTTIIHFQIPIQQSSHHIIGFIALVITGLVFSESNIKDKEEKLSMKNSGQASKEKR